MSQKAHSLSHTKWLCFTTFVFTPKYRRKIVYNQYRSSLGEIFRRLCSYKAIKVLKYRRSSDARPCSYVS